MKTNISNSMALYARQMGAAFIMLGLLAACNTATANSNTSARAMDESRTAQATTDLRPFKALSTGAGAEVTYYQSDEYRVERLNGDANKYHAYVDHNQLHLECKRHRCKGKNNAAFRVYAPSLEKVEIAGGGSVLFADGMAAQDDLRVAIAGGGMVDARALPLNTLKVQIAGGGRVEVGTPERLQVEIAGGGRVRYDGNPKIKMEVSGGGSVKSRN